MTRVTAPAPSTDTAGVGAEVIEQVREKIAREGVELSPAVVASALRCQGRPVGDSTVLAVLDLLRRDVDGAGPLEHLLRLDGVTDVLVNGPGAVYVDRGAGLELTSVRFPDDAAVRRLAQRLAADAGRRLDDASPHVDLRLADGTRLHAVLAPIARPGTSISLRVPRRRVFTLGELQEAGSVPAEGVRLLRLLVQRRIPFLVSGGTGSGKTTLASRHVYRSPQGLRPACLHSGGSPGATGDGSASHGGVQPYRLHRSLKGSNAAARASSLA